MKLNFRELLFRIWYWYVSKVDKNAEVLFMNYGFAEEGKHISLDPKNESNRYSIQLYNHLAIDANINNKDIIEIGCGRGGGLEYITNTFQPASATGVDLNGRAIKFCNQHYKQKNMSFKQGDAQNLDIESEKYDVVMNVESSHRYPDMKSFLDEVSRILRSGGHFLYTDFRYDYEMEELKKQLESSNLTVQKERIITKEVLAALQQDDERRRNLIQKLTPKFLHKIALNFAGTIGSETYNQFDSEKYIYYSYILKKE